MCDKLKKYYISDEEEPQSKTRKVIKPNPKPQNVIRKSNFSQVKINIFDRKYKKWIHKNNTKIYDYFKKVFQT